MLITGIIGIFAYLCFVHKIIPELEIFFQIPKNELILSDISYALYPIFGYLLVATTMVFAVRIFKPLKKSTFESIWQGKTLIVDLIISGLIVGLINEFKNN